MPKMAYSVALAIVMCSSVKAGSLGEGYSAATRGGTVDAGFRMVTIYSHEAACSEREAPHSFEAQDLVVYVGESVRLADLRVSALDKENALVARVPIMINEKNIDSKVFLNDLHQESPTYVALAEGTSTLTIAYLCSATTEVEAELVIRSQRKSRDPI
jgi:hypothetical protein